MKSFFYSMNIGTLAAWMSVAGAGTVACLVHTPEHLPQAIEEKDGLTDGEVFDMDLYAAGSSERAEVDTAANDAAVHDLPMDSSHETEEAPETMEIPELPDLVAAEPLPDVPDLPAPKPKPAANRQPRKTSSSNSNNSRRSKGGSNGPAAKRTTSGSGSGSGSGSSTGSGSGNVGAARFAGGRKPRPSYPSAARRQNIEGSVVVFITVDENGNVVNASIRSASHPSLNDSSILSTLRRWKFRPGPRGSITQTIRFQLH
ncbi:energy transducer TonB [Luteolibacter pohnpeiensis]|uniref:Energy transducer TonB n=1 Tax=Luteolibacter pohnpeiensis TaxID=454153 RepID=A0A934VVM2_9BACT|nr:energy transducer TonB [Luteolibacter pohnpeiensis]MBK1881659.1 energy transducer TonB [Luteolibacter pohnpeiensis]